MANDAMRAKATNRSGVDNDDRLSAVEAHDTGTAKKEHLWIRLDAAEDALAEKDAEIKKLSALVRAYRVGGNDALRHENIELNAKVEVLCYEVANLLSEVPVNGSGGNRKDFDARMRAWNERMCAALKIDANDHAPLEKKKPKSTAWLTDNMI